MFLNKSIQRNKQMWRMDCVIQHSYLSSLEFSQSDQVWEGVEGGGKFPITLIHEYGKIRWIRTRGEPAALCTDRLLLLNICTHPQCVWFRFGSVQFFSGGTGTTCLPEIYRSPSLRWLANFIFTLATSIMNLCLPWLLLMTLPLWASSGILREMYKE